MRTRNHRLAAAATSAALLVLVFFAHGRFREARHAVEQRQAEVAAIQQQNAVLARSAALVRQARFRVKAETPGTLLSIGAVHLDEAGQPQVFQTSACGDWPGESYGAGSLDLSVSTPECSWAGQVAFYVVQFRSQHPHYPRPITLLGSWSNPTHVSDNVVRLP